MKKLITLALFVFSLGIFLPETATASPATATAVGKPQIRVQIGRRTRYHRNRGVGINRAFDASQGQVVIGIDGDLVFPPKLIASLDRRVLSSPDRVK